MKNVLKKIYSNRYFLLFIMMFGYVQSIYIRITNQSEINGYTFTPEAAIFSLFQAGVLFVIMLFFLKKWQKADDFSTKELLKIFISSILAFLLLMKISGLLLAFTFGTIERNFNEETFYFSLFSDFLNGVIFGSFFLAYYYFNKSKNHQQQLAKYNQALAESKIHQLKGQLNPHFLFNNLNVLDQLIEEDKNKASDFLNEFADIYRYVLQVSDKKMVSLEEEMTFAEQYFGLIQHKYGAAYQLQVRFINKTGFIVPLTLQLLIENAVQHNLGTAGNPIYITIDVDEKIHVRNNKRKKSSSKVTSGRALMNVKEQYKLLTSVPVEIHQSEAEFSVKIPIIGHPVT